MHQSFTGNSRRVRQVNLSGRGPSNPWASTSKSGLGPLSTSGGGGSGSNPVAQAQADRLKRQQERDRLNAARRIQRLWRGHWTRRRQRAHWRNVWDEVEQKSLGPRADLKEVLQDADARSPSAQDLPQLQQQIHRLLRFQEFRQGRVRDETDNLRLIYLGKTLQQSIPTSPALPLDHAGRQLLSSLGKVTARHLESALLNHRAPRAVEVACEPRLLDLIGFLAQLVPDEMAADAVVYFDVLGRALDAQAGQKWQDHVVRVMVEFLTRPQQGWRISYTAFANMVLCRGSFVGMTEALDHLAASLDLDALSLALSKNVEDMKNTKDQPQPTSPWLWQLAHLIYLHDVVRKGDAGPSAYIEALSALLGTCANDIAQRLDDPELATHRGNGGDTPALPDFIQEMVLRIPRHDSVRAVLDQMDPVTSPTTRGQGLDFESATRLANYAVALLRAFPSRAQNIRMYLYQGSVRSMGSTTLSIIQYFWGVVRATRVFQKSTQNHRHVLSLLKEAAPDARQHGQTLVSGHDVALWRDEWRVIILFLELYTFVLKFMDDDDFFSLDKSRTFGATGDPSPVSLLSRKAALPLDDVALMSTFLKNLAFTLYWHAADLVQPGDLDEDAGLSTLFGTSHLAATSRPVERKKQTLTGNDVSQDYLKGLVTGLLRMLHERDSRRPFVPPTHWLMTDQVNMSGFIPAVVGEEERRHQLNDDDDDDVDMDEDPLVDPAAAAVNATAFGAFGGAESSDILLSDLFGIRQPHTPRSRASRQAELLEQHRLQARKKRHLEALGPRLEILRNLPFFIPFETRVQIFREFISQDQIRRRDGAVEPDTWRLFVTSTNQGAGPDGRPRALDILSRHHAEIRRESCFEDAYEAFYGLGEGLKEPIQITFIDQFGAPEAGIDGGGVTKEFLMSVTGEALMPHDKVSMFSENSQGYLYPNPLIYDATVAFLKPVYKAKGDLDAAMAEFLRRFQFLGRIVGKCLYEGILIDVTFAGFFLLKWALTGGSTVGSNESAYRATINDVREYDEELYQGLLKLKNYPGDVETDFSLDFTVTDTIPVTDEHGHESHQTVTRDLMPQGAKTLVTNANRLLYIDRIVRYRLQQQPRAVTDAFLRGLGQVIQPMWLAMFNQKELQTLVGGDNSELDIDDLRRNTLYGGVYAIGDDGLEHPTVQLFWKALQDMDDASRRKVVKFVTSTPRAPLLGFGHLNPKFSIRDSSDDQTRLPSTSTCVNLLKLPRYGDLTTMREKLLYAVNAGAGFDLS